MAEVGEKNRKRNRMLMMAISIGGYSLGYYVSIMNSMSKPILEGQYNMSEDEQVNINGNMNFLYSIGAMIGELSNRPLLSWIGRRKMNIGVDFMVIFIVGLMTIKDVWILQGTRLLIGFSSALHCSVGGITLVEIMPTKLASLGNTLIYTTITIFVLITFAQQSLMSYDTLKDNWRFFLCYPALISALRIFLLLGLFNFDSPEDVLKDKSLSTVEQEARLKRNLSAVFDSDTTDFKAQEMIAKQKAVIEEPTFAAMFSRTYRKLMASAAFVNVGQQLSGVNFLVFFSTQLFDKISNNGKTISFVFGFGNFVGSFFCMYFVTRYSRLFSMRLGSFVQGVSLLLLLVLIKLEVYSVLPVFIFTYIIFYAVGLGATPGLYTNEILPPAGVGLCLSTSWLTSSIIGKVSPLAVQKFGSEMVILVFGIVCILLSVVIGVVCFNNGMGKVNMKEYNNSLIEGSEIEAQVSQENRDRLKLVDSRM